ncbi:hypothetical protein SDJN03_24799, partial [Cucurbita argyrosperma subsp. sororia]
MDFFFFDKAEKVSSSVPRCNLLQLFAKFFRFIEFCFLLVFISWTLSRLPIAVRISSEYFGKLLGFIASPLFGFLLCNAIIVALVAKPSQFSGHSAETERIYENLIEKSGSRDLPDSLAERDSSIAEEVEIVYQDKQIIVESESVVDHPKVILRSLSEKLTRECVTTQSEKLRRSETEKCRNLEHSHDILFFQEDLSNEEFQKKIEAFIAKEKKFRREESCAIVLRCDG